MYLIYEENKLQAQPQNELNLKVKVPQYNIRLSDLKEMRYSNACNFFFFLAVSLYIFLFYVYLFVYCCVALIFSSPGGIPARNVKGERLLLFLGIIDILQSFRLKKKLEHTFKSMIHDGVSNEVKQQDRYLESNISCIYFHVSIFLHNSSSNIRIQKGSRENSTWLMQINH